MDTLGRSFRLVQCRSWAVAIASERYLHLLFQAPSGLGWLRNCRGGAWKALRTISFARLAARSLRAPPRVNVVGETQHLQTGCVLAFFHSPWDRLLARWATSRDFALILAGDRMAPLLAGLYVKADRHGLYRLVRHLHSGGRVAVSMDLFVDAGGWPARFFDAPVRVLPVAVRLASLSGVPVVPISVVYVRGSLQLRVGPAIGVGGGVAEEARAVRAGLQLFERTIRDDPAAWRGLLRFLRKAHTHRRQPRAAEWQPPSLDGASVRPS